MTKPRTEIRCHRLPWSDGVDCAVLHFDRTGLASVAVAPIMTPIDEGMRIEPTLRLDNADAQMLIDELWRCGLRPTEGSGSAGSLAATERHLADMRTIALGLLRPQTGGADSTGPAR